MKREDLVSYLDGLLQPAKFRDYCPNGLQVEGRREVSRIVTGVTASQALLNVAVDQGADTILVHHGYFWKGEDGRVCGIRKQRLKTLLMHDINLLAYHLPLDAHPELGNNAQLARRLGWVADGRFGEQEIAWIGRPIALDCGHWRVGEMAAQLAKELNREPLLLGDADRKVNRVAWCSGGAQGYFEQAIALGADVYVSGEISEQTVHLARESGVAYLACGHHATERFGAQALALHLAAQFAVQAEFVEIENPV